MSAYYTYLKHLSRLLNHFFIFDLFLNWNGTLHNIYTFCSVALISSTSLLPSLLITAFFRFSFTFIITYLTLKVYYYSVDICQAQPNWLTKAANWAGWYYYNNIHHPAQAQAGTGRTSTF